MVLSALTLLATIVTSTPAEPAWNKAAESDGVVVLARETASGVQEMKAQGTFEASPQKVMEMLNDHEHYVRFIPYTESSHVVGTEEGGKAIYFHSVLSMPMVSKRDYVLRIVDESDWRDGKGYLKTSWKVAPNHPPAPAPGVVRITLNDGYWLLEPRDEGKRTFATYYLYTDVGGSVPKFLVNSANASAIPNVFKALRQELARR